MKKKLKIVHVITSLKMGGAEMVLATLLREFIKLYPECEHHVIYFHDGPMRAQIEALNISVAACSYTPKSLYGLYQLLKKIKPDVIHSSLWSANFLARIYALLLGVPIACALHTVAEHAGKIRTFLDKLLPVQPQRYIAVSIGVAHSYHNVLRVDPVHMCMIPNGITVPQYVPKKRTDIFTIGAVGRFVPVKNFDLLIKSFAQLHVRHVATCLMLVGVGPQEDYLRALVQQLHLDDVVTFIIGKSAHDYYQEFDCFVQPSAYEGLSIALLEALSYQLPVIVTGSAAQHDVIVHCKHGLVVEPTQDAITRALEYIFEHAQEAEIYAHKGHELVLHNFTAQRMAQRYHELFIQMYCEAHR